MPSSSSSRPIAEARRSAVPTRPAVTTAARTAERCDSSWASRPSCSANDRPAGGIGHAGRGGLHECQDLGVRSHRTSVAAPLRPRAALAPAAIAQGRPRAIPDMPARRSPARAARTRVPSRGRRLHRPGSRAAPFVKRPGGEPVRVGCSVVVGSRRGLRLRRWTRAAARRVRVEPPRPPGARIPGLGQHCLDLAHLIGSQVKLTLPVARGRLHALELCGRRRERIVRLLVRRECNEVVVTARTGRGRRSAPQDRADAGPDVAREPRLVPHPMTRAPRRWPAGRRCAPPLALGGDRARQQHVAVFRVGLEPCQSLARGLAHVEQGLQARAAGAPSRTSDADPLAPSASDRPTVAGPSSCRRRSRRQGRSGRHATRGRGRR